MLLAVSDDGCGMDKEILDQIFEPFFTSKGVGQGTGLGLSTVYGIVKQNNGFINVYSEPGKGTTFRIYLPRYAGQAVDTQRERAAEIPLSHGETVLVVEDEPALLTMGKMMLEKLGYRVLAAGTPGEAIGLAEEHASEIHLLITDVVMPEMNGRDLAERLQSLYPGMKILFMSGYTADVIAHRGVLDEGVNFAGKGSLIATMPIYAMTSDTTYRSSLTRFAWLSIAAAILTIALKAIAYLLTGSVGLLSDTMESFVNLVGALMALAMLTIAARPADEDHAYGHSKAEYFSSGVEGTLILLAAAGIAVAAIPRLLAPRPLEQVGLGLGVSVAASLVNLFVGRILLRAGKQNHSITLEANAQHLMTDVWTSAGVLVGVGAVVLTGWDRLDPVVALIVAGNIVRSGVLIVRKSVLGLMDTALPAEDQGTLRRCWNRSRDGVEFHALRTRQSGARQFVSLHVLVPSLWTVHRGHRLLESIEADIRHALPGVTVFTHLESLSDPASWDDTSLDRTGAQPIESSAQDHRSSSEGEAKASNKMKGCGHSAG